MWLEAGCNVWRLPALRGGKSQVLLRCGSRWPGFRGCYYRIGVGYSLTHNTAAVHLTADTCVTAPKTNNTGCAHHTCTSFAGTSRSHLIIYHHNFSNENSCKDHLIFVKQPVDRSNFPMFCLQLQCSCALLRVCW